MRCEICMYWLEDRIPPGTEDSPVRRRYCRRYPPEIHIAQPTQEGGPKIANFYWPVVAAVDWCGEFKGKGNTLEPAVKRTTN